MLDVVLIGGVNDGRRLSIGANAMVCGRVELMLPAGNDVSVSSQFPSELDAANSEFYYSTRLHTVTGSVCVWLHSDFKVSDLLPHLLKGYTNAKEIN